MIASVQIKRIFSEVLQHLLRDVRIIPEKHRILSDVLQKTKNFILGEPGFKALGQLQGRPSNIPNYNANVVAAATDVNDYIEESLDQTLVLLRNFNASYVELRRISFQVNEVMSNIDRLAHYQDGYRYVVGDTFNSLDKVDTLRSTITIDPSSKRVFIQSGSKQVADLAFLSNIAVPTNLGFSRPIIRYTTDPGSRFGSIFDGTTAYWKFRAFTSMPGELTASFEIPLSKNGSVVGINGAYFDSLSIGRIILEHNLDGVWRTIVTDDLSHTNILSFKAIFTNLIRVTITLPDAFQHIGNTYVYEFGFRSIGLYLTSSRLAGEFISKPIQISSEEIAGGVALDLVVDSAIPPGCSISYFVAIDPYITGVLYAEEDYSIEGVDPYAYGTDGIRWSSDLSGGYTLSSTLRDFYTVTGLSAWKTWEPIWQEISPSSDISNPVFLDFSNHVGEDESLNGFPEAARSYGEWGNINFIKIFEFTDSSGAPIVPTNVDLYGGKNCFLFSERFYSYKDDIVGQGNIVGGRMTILGTARSQVVRGSVKNVRAWGIDISANESMFSEPNDYIVNYGTPNEYSAELVQNAGRINVAEGQTLPVQFSYSYRRNDPFYALETSFYYDENILKVSTLSESVTIEPIIKIYWWVGSASISEILLINYDENGIELGRASEGRRGADELVTINIRNVGSGRGWFTLRITLSDLSANALGHLNQLQLMRRVIFPPYITIFAWKDKLRQVSEDHLKYSTHKFDHSKFAVVRQANGIYALVSTNIGQFSGNTRLLYHDVPINPTNGIIGMDLSEFYSMEYMTSAGAFNSVLFKAVFQGTGDTSPELRGYTLRVLG